MKIAVGSDHGGLALKTIVLALLQELGHDGEDVGCFDTDSVDYPQFADLVCGKVTSGQADKGILICGTGIGMSMAANRHDNIRAALCSEQYTARMSREHNDANVLCIGERVTGPGIAEEIVRTWLSTPFNGGRHLRRIELFN
ncbi:MAG: ribose 5-phosphate isomerase B [Proteobacteria bacterium]|nr:ribose 5-phosphate isomerase B [Pseudomonadota bacterium]MBU1234504.1 ribose 5-phosphate isomerase B [Pseudomonadota bacterium]MBU1417968.1 ribose 5-phosphate isomerase B [Pseudomonadota bacterium]MBU1453557.1 ribose 5-phosphate isomerase B [Pseudomonadota bacterium]